MSTDNSSVDDISSFSTSEISLPRMVRFWLMLLFNIPSVICAFVLIVYIILDRTQRYAIHNHTILLILIVGLPVQLLDINLYLVFFLYGSVQPSTPLICRLWFLTDYGFYCGGLILMAWLAIERHILIFYDRWVGNRRGRFLFHYLPLIILLTYIMVFNTVAYLFIPCIDIYIYSVPICGASPCYQSYGILGMWEFIVNSTAPICVEGIATITLVARVQQQKRRLHQSNQWRKQRRMIIQLFLISTLNVGFNAPIYIIPLLRFAGFPSDFGVQTQLYFFFLGYFVIFLFPFASLCQYPNLRKKFNEKICFLCQRLHRTATIAPVVAVILVLKLK